MFTEEPTVPRELWKNWTMVGCLQLEKKIRGSFLELRNFRVELNPPPTPHPVLQSNRVSTHFNPTSFSRQGETLMLGWRFRPDKE